MYARICKYIACAQQRLAAHARLLTLLGGSSVVALWTILRHITNGINFDVVGQIGLAQQWTSGLHSGAQLGVTSYLLKIPLYMLVNLFGFISPMNRILALALICNIATFVLLLVLFEKILKLYRVERRGWLYLSMLWLSTIAGNVFWVDYANSRNLETVGGILFVYLVLRFLKNPTLRQSVLITGVGSIVFFADSLQLYVCGLGLCVFAAGQWLLQQTAPRLKMAASVIGLVVLSTLGARVIRVAVEHLLHVTFLQTPHTPVSQIVHQPGATLHALASNSLNVFGADFLGHSSGFNALRELLNALVLVGIVALVLKMQRQVRRRALSWLVFAIIVTNYGIYLASGQVLVWATTRYLIMIPIVVALLIGSFADNKLTKRTQRHIQLGWLALSLASTVLLAGGVVSNWSARHSKDSGVYNVASFMESHGFTYGLSSREIGVSSTYFTQGKASILPMLCDANHHLYTTDLFYDRAPFMKAANYIGDIPIIIPGGGITTGNLTCDQSAIMQQYGPAKRVIIVPRVGEALVYDSKAIQAQPLNQFAN
jgi:hypothetical protein